jgi:hypothetical protein
MNFKKNFWAFLSFFALMFSTLIAAKAGSAQEDADNLIGQWQIINSTGQVLDTIDINLVVSKNNLARFDYTRASDATTNPSRLQGLMTNKVLIFQLVDLGYTTTYVVDLDFTLGGGPGLELKSRTANCTLVGKATNLVAKKYEARLSDNSASCDGFSLYDATTQTIKLVKVGVDSVSIPLTASIPDGLINNLDKVDTRLSGAWFLKSGKRNFKFLVKDVEAHHLGYRFAYKLTEGSTNLDTLNQTDFITGLREGLLVNNFLILSSSRFGKNDELYIVKLNKTIGSGNLYSSPNGDCFPLKEPVNGTVICTPNDDSDLINNVTSIFGSRKISKIDTKVTISF